MKKVNKKFKAIFIAMLIALSTSVSYAQWQNTNFTGNGPIESTVSTVTGVGVGDFSASNVASALHVNTNLTAAQTGGGAFGLGEVFRTDAPNTATYWKMLRGGTDYGWIYNNNDNHFYIAAPFNSGGNYGDLYFQTGGTNTRQTILGSNGFVGIGNSYNPAFRLDVSEDINAGGTSATTTNAYYLGKGKMLWHNGIVSNLYVGVGVYSGHIEPPIPAC
ncbi:MAG: hypothetical protein ABI763_13835 [Bacteroidota bacterium]